MEAKISENWRIAIKWFNPKKCGGYRRWVLSFRNYNLITNRYGFEFRLFGLGIGAMSKPY